MVKILEKWSFIHKYRKELNGKNPYALKTQERIRLKIERNVVLKFFIIVAVIFILIYVLNLPFNILISDLDTNAYVKYISFPVSDANSARYFFSAVPQSLAALLAISFTVLLIYLQISTDRYSIQTVRYIFHGRAAITVISIFLITIIYSFFELCKIRDYSDSYMGVTTFPWDGAILTIFILTVLCGLFLILFFYKTISGLIPEIFIRESGERIKKASMATLDFTQLIRLKNSFFKNKIKDMENVEESYFPGGFSLSDSKHPVKTTKRGFVQDIDISKIGKCSKLISSVSSDCKLQLNIPIEGKVSSASNVLGFIECSNSEIIPKVERLVEKAYKIDNKNTWMLEDYNELEPISSLTTKAIKEFEKGVAEIALRELTDRIIEYIKARKNFGLMPSFEEAEDIRWGRHFLDESFKHLEKIMKISIKESDPDIIDLILYLNRRIGNESITLQDSDTLKKVTGFYLYFSYRLEEDFIDRILLYSRDLELKTIWDLEKEKENMDYIKGHEYVLKELADYYGNLTRILMDNQTRFATVSLDKLLGIDSRLKYLMYDNTQLQLDMKLGQLEPESEVYQKIKNKLEIIEEKEKVSRRLKSNLGFMVYSIGTYVMVNIEREKYTIEFSQPIFDKLVDFFKKNNVEEVFNRSKGRDTFFSIDHWFHEYEDEEVHILDSSYVDRFYLLISALLIKKGVKKLNEIKPVDRFNTNQLETFKKEFEKLKEETHIWDQLFEGESQKYFGDTFQRLEEVTGKREENLHEKVRQAELSGPRVNEVRRDIVTNTRWYSEARNFIDVERATEEDEQFLYLGRNILFDKICFVEESVDSTTYHAYDTIGVDIGQDIGVGESDYLIKQIFEKINIKENKIEFETFSTQNLDRAKEELERRGFKATTIITSIDLSFNLWRMDGFTYSDRGSEEMPVPYGTIDGIEVYDSRVLPKGVAIIFDKTHIGTLKILKELSPIITTYFDKEGIIEKELEEGKITEEQREEQLNELDEKVNIKALEKIKFEFGNYKAGLVLFIKSTESL